MVVLVWLAVGIIVANALSKPPDPTDAFGAEVALGANHGIDNLWKYKGADTTLTHVTFDVSLLTQNAPVSNGWAEVLFDLAVVNIPTFVNGPANYVQMPAAPNWDVPLSINPNRYLSTTTEMQSGTIAAMIVKMPLMAGQTNAVNKTVDLTLNMPLDTGQYLVYHADDASSEDIPLDVEAQVVLSHT